MKTLVLANNKGGVGKSTITIILATYFALIKKKRVMVIDLDPQCNVSRHFLPMEAAQFEGEMFTVPPVHPEYQADDPVWEGDGRSSSADIYKFGGAFPYPTEYPGLDIIPAHGFFLRGIEQVRQDEVKNAVHGMLTGFINDPDLQNEIDLLIFDTMPSKGPITTSALNAATHLLIPAEMERMSIEGLFGMLSYFFKANMMRSKGNELKLIGILANKFMANNTLHQKYFDTLAGNEQLSPYLCPHVFHNWQGYKELADYSGGPLWDRKPSDKCRSEAELVCQFVDKEMF